MKSIGNNEITNWYRDFGEHGTLISVIYTENVLLINLYTLYNNI